MRIVNKSLFRSKWVFCGYNWNFQLVRVNSNFYDSGKSRNERTKQVYNEISFPQFWRDLNRSGQSMFQRPFRELTRKKSCYTTPALHNSCIYVVLYKRSCKYNYWTFKMYFIVKINMLPMQLHQLICQYYFMSINYLV